jgi:large subunit ribosomal protein L25
LATKNEGISLELRELTGTVGARKSRSSGRIPGVIYGHGQTPLAIAVEAKAVGTLLHGRRQSIIDVTLDGKKDTAIVREVQLDPVTRRVLSIDFQRVSRTDVITANVPIVTVGTPAGVREQGGLMDLVTHEIVVRGPADKIPEAIRIDVSALTIGQNIAASELQLGEGMRSHPPPDTTIVSISAPRVEEEAAPAAAPEGAEAAAPAEGGAPSEATPAQ